MASPQPVPQVPANKPDKTAKDLEDAIMMPPPPLPTQAPAGPLNTGPKVILEPEIDGLLKCVKNVAAQTGLVYKFYYSTQAKHKQRIQPPRSVTAAISREIESYDQICDSLEAKVLRALAVFQRDLAREEKRIEDERRALLSKQDQDQMSVDIPPEDSGTPPLKSEESASSLQGSSPVSGTHLGRRPSAVSISSLHRPAFPHKLDLSSVSFRMSAGEDSAIFQSGLASPVTLAPKSARALGPSEIPDFMFDTTNTDSTSHPADIDLTLPDVMHDGSRNSVAGGSADAPIELDLDLDMTELFGDDPDSAGPTQESMQPTDGLFGSSGEDETNFFGDVSQHDSVLSELGSDANQGGPSGSNTLDNTVSSPGSLLATFSSQTTADGNSQALTDSEFNFDNIDLSLEGDFFSDAQGTADMSFPADFTMTNSDNKMEMQ
ncbi:hypothetical protein FA15DRAFT_751691 [Coprinopsis marcescibilis]|uniref:Uncharacterized protein n=1 Tax=Coprinopsis marcescibilis TaxID=230819 RepID=A0A5C3LD41_COPMA|nr:hypothetical protein FA15DRAFT_751691 [Coprinopsis marcescibilis]